MNDVGKKLDPSNDSWKINWLNFNIEDDFIYFAKHSTKSVKCARYAMHEVNWTINKIDI